MTDYRHRDARAWDAPRRRRLFDRHAKVGAPNLNRPTTRHERRAHGVKMAEARAFLATLKEPRTEPPLPFFLRPQAW